MQMKIPKQMVALTTTSNRTRASTWRATVDAAGGVSNSGLARVGRPLRHEFCLDRSEGRLHVRRGLSIRASSFGSRRSLAKVRTEHYEEDHADDEDSQTCRCGQDV